MFKYLVLALSLIFCSANQLYANIDFCTNSLQHILNTSPNLHNLEEILDTALSRKDLTPKVYKKLERIKISMEKKMLIGNYTGLSRITIADLLRALDNLD